MLVICLNSLNGAINIDLKEFEKEFYREFQILKW